MARSIRHSPLLSNADFLWSGIRPLYNALLSLAARHGLPRLINGTDPIRILPSCRSIAQVYEPEVWADFMALLRPGDNVVDVGAHYGIYALAAAKRLGPAGRVHAFEPLRANRDVLRAHVKLNALEQRIHIYDVAISDSQGEASFHDEREQSHLAFPGDSGGTRVQTSTIDKLFPEERIDVLKIDVEGFEEYVLKGASDLLSNPARRPRAVLIEVHPYAWEHSGTTSESLLSHLRGFHLKSAPGRLELPVCRYGHIFALSS